MKILLPWLAETPLHAISFRFEHYLEGFRALGHEPCLVTREGLASDFPLPALEVPMAYLRSPDFWRSQGAEVAVTLSWHRHSAELEALREGGLQVVAITDSDGLVGLRTHPAMTLERMLVYRRGLRPRLGCIKYWIGRYLTDGLTGQREDLEYLASTRASDAVVLGSQPAIQAFRRFLRFHRAEDELAPRLREVPYAVPETFCTAPLPPTRRPAFVALARWSDPQKNAGLLAQALELFLPHHPEAEVEFFGLDAEPFFGSLAQRYPKVRLLGGQPPPRVLESLGSCRAVIFASRWETGPHAATEALALGASLVGTPIPNLVGLTQGGHFGTVATAHRPRALAEALTREWRVWEEGERDPLAIAEHWRPRLHPASICQQLLDTLQPSGSFPPGAGYGTLSETSRKP